MKLILCCILLSSLFPVQDADLSKGILVLVNKTYQLPEQYKPAHLVAMPDKYSTGELKELQQPAMEAFVQMCDAARKDGHWLHNRSAYRTHAIQQMLYNRNVAKYGAQKAALYSARPRHSEHQTGLAVDINKVALDFEKTPAFAWLQENAHKFGFIMRYPRGKEAITGYEYEPWHYRYVGKEAATFIHKHHLVFEEYIQYFQPN